MCSSGGSLKKGDSRLFYDLSPEYTHVAVVGVAPSTEAMPPDSVEDVDMAAQGVREAAAVGTKLLQKARVKSVLLDDFSNPQGEPQSIGIRLGNIKGL